MFVGVCGCPGAALAGRGVWSLSCSLANVKLDVVWQLHDSYVHLCPVAGVGMLSGPPVCSSVPGAGWGIGAHW